MLHKQPHKFGKVWEACAQKANNARHTLVHELRVAHVNRDLGYKSQEFQDPYCNAHPKGRGKASAAIPPATINPEAAKTRANFGGQESWGYARNYSAIPDKT